MRFIRIDNRTLMAFLLVLSLGLFAAGCKKKIAPPPPPPTPAPAPAPAPPAAPSITSFDAEPGTIEKGASSTLRWAVDNASDVSIDNGIGNVPARGSRQVYPSQTTTYTLTAKGPGGTDSRTATVTVTQPPPPPPPPTPPKMSFSEMIASKLQDAYFDYDKNDVREDARATLTRNADALKQIFQDYPSGVALVEGHCDERGSAEYNLGLGDRRATSARDFLVQLGIPADRLKTVSYGKERPQCTESNEDCWQKNRRAHFSAGQ
jgi:peptidoglycan-associated lipoprotein